MNPQIVPQALRSISHMVVATTPFSGLRDPTMLGNQSSSASICITAAAIVWWLLFLHISVLVQRIPFIPVYHNFGLNVSMYVTVVQR